MQTGVNKEQNICLGVSRTVNRVRGMEDWVLDLIFAVYSGTPKFVGW